MCRRSVALICASPRGVLSGVRMIVERRAYAVVFRGILTLHVGTLVNPITWMACRCTS